MKMLYAKTTNMMNLNNLIISSIESLSIDFSLHFNNIMIVHNMKYYKRNHFKSDITLYIFKINADMQIYADMKIDADLKSHADM